jgi:hypothetical protein
VMRRELELDVEMRERMVMGMRMGMVVRIHDGDGDEDGDGGEDTRWGVWGRHASRQAGTTSASSTAPCAGTLMRPSSSLMQQSRLSAAILCHHQLTPPAMRY